MLSLVECCLTKVVLERLNVAALRDLEEREN